MSFLNDNHCAKTVRVLHPVQVVCVEKVESVCLWPRDPDKQCSSPVSTYEHSVLRVSGTRPFPGGGAFDPR